MSTEYAEKERAFVTALSDETGHDLDGWMLQISGSQLTERNDIIDWLRHRGFTFARASWLERIHHNGGRLIYAGEKNDAGPASDFQNTKQDLAELAALPPSQIKPSRQQGEPTTPITEVLLGAKGLRPLADLILREIEQIVPELIVEANAQSIELSAPKRFAIVLPEPKSIKIFADFGSGPPTPAKRAEIASKKSPQPYPHVVELSDARRVDAAFLTLIKSANARING